MGRPDRTPRSDAPIRRPDPPTAVPDLPVPPPAPNPSAERRFYRRERGRVGSAGPPAAPPQKEDGPRRNMKPTVSTAAEGGEAGPSANCSASSASR